MAARRRRSRQRRGRGRYGFLYKLLSFLVIFTALLVGCVVFFRVNQVTVTGNSRYSAQEVIDASRVELGDNLLLVNKPQTARNITRQLPYVESVSPIRRLPDVLELRITETKAVAALYTGDGCWLINSATKLVELGEEGLGEGLPQVLGLSPLSPALGARVAVDIAEQTRLEGLKSLLTALNERGMTGGIRQFIDLHALNAIYFDYGEDLTVVVPVSGDHKGVVQRLQRTLETLDEMGEAAKGTLDLTYGDEQARLLTERWLPEQYRAVAEPALPEPSQPTEEGTGAG